MRQVLERDWTLTFTHPESGETMTIPAQVPGNVIADLHRAGVVPDPYFGLNSAGLRIWEFVDFEYRTGFRAPETEPGERLELVLEGADTVGEVRLNGDLLGELDNMFIEHRFDVTGRAAAGTENRLAVLIRSAVNAARKFHRTPDTFTLAYNYEGLYLRKAGHTYGWDIAPRIVGGGLWRGVFLEQVPADRWTGVLLYTTHASKQLAKLVLDWNFETAAERLTGFGARLVMKHGESRFEKQFRIDFTSGRTAFEIADPHLWNVRGHGDPALYDVTLELLHDGETVAVRRFRTGIRTVRLDRTESLSPGGDGEFRFLLNGEPLFVHGSNWVPAEAMHGEARDRIRRGLELFADLGCNMVRCWGGGVYEDHDFFDYCDEHGMLVWQDFMLACQLPPQDDDFARRIEAEATAVIRKLRNHPSLALWCGDNECDEAALWSGGGERFPSANRITREVLKRAVLANDPGRDYLPSSPYLTDSAVRLGSSGNAPEQHLWGPRDEYKGDFYRLNTARFASETGYHGMPCVESLKKFLSPDHLFPKTDDPEYLIHAAQPYGDPSGPYAYRIKLLLDQVENTFGSVPRELDKLVAASQAVQAEAVKFFIENFRFRKWNKTGILWWNVIDCWPQISDAVVDYYYEKKLAYYYIRNVQQPVLLMMGEPASWHCELRLDNNLPGPAAGRYRVSDLLTGEEIAAGRYECGANCCTGLGAIRVSSGKHRMHLLEWEVNGEWKCSHYLLGHTPYDLDYYLKCRDAILSKLNIPLAGAE